MPNSYWGEALSVAAYLINCVPSSSLNFQTPFEVLHSTVTTPTALNLSPRIFGCVAFVHLPKPLRDKLEPRALRCVFVGYASLQKGYRCYHPHHGKSLSPLMLSFMKMTCTILFPSPQFKGRDKMNCRL